MNHYPAPLISLINELAKLPGIGKKTAERLSMHILRMKQDNLNRLIAALHGIKNVEICGICFTLCDSGKCSFCSNTARDPSVICVVEKDSDMAAIEKSGAYKGLYHVLQGCLSPMDGIGPDEIRVSELIARVKKGGIREIILATNTNVEGEATASYLKMKLSGFPLNITRIASGVPMGGDIRYVDQVTLKRALESRHGI